jgi:thiol:disulfide interchange protein
MRLRWIAVVVVVVAGCGHEVGAREPIVFSTDVDGTLRAAADEHRPALVFAGARWDANSEQLEHDTFCDAEVVSAMTRFAGAKVDYTDETPAADRNMARVGATVVPTLIVFASDGREIDRIVGLVSADELARRLARAR